MAGTRKELKRIAKTSGYTYKFLLKVYKETLKDDGEVDMNYFEAVSMEHDW